MNTKRSMSVIVATLFVSATLAFTMAPVLGAPSPAPVSTALTRACVGAELNMKGSPACVTSLEKSLGANSADLMALRMAAKSRDQAIPKQILMKHGLTASQVKGATIVISDESGGAKSLHITITISCCPLTIKIVLRK